MPRRANGPARALPDGTYEFSVQPEERETLVELFTQLRDAIDADGESGHLRRLFPVAYNDDPSREAEYRRLMHDDLRANRIASIDAICQICRREGPSVMLTEEEFDVLIAGVNSLRLVLGTLLDVGEDDEGPDSDDPTYGQHQLYLYLGWLLEWLVGTRRGL